MGILATDNFNRANSGTLGANWTKLTSFFDLGITTNQCGASASGDSADEYTAVSFPADQYAQVNVNATSDGGPSVRSNGAGSFYFVDTLATEWDITKCINGVFTALVTNVLTPASGDLAYIQVQGSTLVEKRNGAQLNTTTDSTLTSGRAGIFISGTSLFVDNWEAGDFQDPLFIRTSISVPV